MRMKKIYLTAGHAVIDGKGNGAFGIKEKNGKQFDEAVEARKLTDDILKHYRKYYGEIETDSPGWSLGGVINWLIGKVKKDDVAVEVHFNASSSIAATGTEVIIPNANDNIERKLAADLSDRIGRVLSIKNRGVKTEADTFHKKIGILNKPSAATNILIEICFITNPVDVKMYRERYWELVKTISDILGNYITNKGQYGKI